MIQNDSRYVSKKSQSSVANVKPVEPIWLVIRHKLSKRRKNKRNVKKRIIGGHRSTNTKHLSSNNTEMREKKSNKVSCSPLRD